MITTDETCYVKFSKRESLPFRRIFLSGQFKHDEFYKYINSDDTFDDGHFKAVSNGSVS